MLTMCNQQTNGKNEQKLIGDYCCTFTHTHVLFNESYESYDTNKSDICVLKY